MGQTGEGRKLQARPGSASEPRKSSGAGHEEHLWRVHWPLLQPGAVQLLWAMAPGAERTAPARVRARRAVAKRIERQRKEGGEGKNKGKKKKT